MINTKKIKKLLRKADSEFLKEDKHCGICEEASWRRGLEYCYETLRTIEALRKGKGYRALLKTE